ncbi:tyrosine protein phosphatase [Peribacillus saganii]|uniref:Tyrosine-protein phosphatase n=1 Tax=Peribacillus saganii TaxID=2303992 RepID=A0A372LLJ0_9BACI|nr:CpsB/CapC family capsule biosynthesis tyrosine phosphatase [Peribacillus saganii]RFU67116.1 tyrosine protein phosphatase [Peribacillus saganii]
MIDIHNHIIPGLDDGASDITESIAMAKHAVSEGIHTIIATPHHKNGRYENDKQTILQQCDLLNKTFAEESISLTILPGQEIRLNGDVLSDYEKGEILTLNQTQYIFIELPSNHVPRYTEKMLFDMQMNGLSPIIVHPERNQEIIENPDILYNFVKNGTLSQITASSITGHFGKKIKKFTSQLIDANLTHFVASDAHNLSSRTFRMMEALDEIEKNYGVDMFYQFTENAELLVRGEAIYKEVPEKVKTKKFLGIF